MKYTIDYTTNFKKQHKKAKKQGKDLNKLYEIINKLANNEILEPKYKNHSHYEIYHLYNYLLFFHNLLYH